jgi:hypothetical protein
MKKLLTIIGGALIVGAIGSEQIGVISFTQSLMQCVVGLPMFAIGVM